mgnify:CR=1 FL=1
MKEKNFNPGDIVKLKSGSPKMTILGNHKSVADEYDVAWFDSKEEVKFSHFPCQVLELEEVKKITLNINNENEENIPT